MIARHASEKTKIPEVIYEDNQILVAHKLPGVLSQADGSQNPDMLTLLKNDLKIRYNKPGDVFLGLVHRLDQPVGGLMVFARTSKAASRLSAQVREHQLEKIYLAVLSGYLEPKKGCMQDFLLKDPSTRNVRIAHEGQGQPAWLDYQVLEERQDLKQSLVAIRLGTGRGHQIRVQLAARKCPIVGDRRYGPPDFYGIKSADMALLACCLGFYHPVGKQWLQFSLPFPDSLPWTSFIAPDIQELPLLFT